MLENKKFVAWANENIIVVAGQTETEHPAEIEDAKGKAVPGCSLYPGLTCEQHKAIPGECRRPAEGLPAIEITNMMPNSWLVSPSGEVVQVESAVQQSAGKIEELVAEMQKEHGKPLTWKKYKKYQEAFELGDTALGGGKLKAAIKAFQKVEKDAKKLPEAMKEEVQKRLDAVNAKAAEAFAGIRDGSEDLTVKLKAANKLKTEVGARFKQGYLPIVDEIKVWLKEAKARAK